MFVFGHLGFGNKLATPWRRNLPKIPLFLGMLLPDIIDKTLYYGNLFLRDHYHVFWDFITCTRTFGHTGILLLLVLAAAGLIGSRTLAALALGMATHVLLDCLMDRFTPDRSSALIALTWPLMQKHFAVFWFNSIADHGKHLLNRPIIAAELLGLSFLGWDYWKSKLTAGVGTASAPRTAKR